MISRDMVNDDPAVRAQPSRHFGMTRDGRRRCVEVFDDRERWIAVRQNAGFEAPIAAGVQLTRDRAAILLELECERR
jgi:hypothetical protein